MELTKLDVTEKKAQQFVQKGIYTAEALVEYLPTGYKDYTKETGLLPEGEVSVVVVQTERISTYDGGKVPVITVDGHLVDLTTKQPGPHIQVCWFNQRFVYKRLVDKMGLLFYLAAKIKYEPQYNTLRANAPDVFEVLTPNARRIYPVYKKIPGMSMDYLTEKIDAALKCPEVVAEKIPLDVVQEYHQIPRRDALYYLHHPASMEQVKKGRGRILFDELLYFALHNEWAKKSSVPVSPAMILSTEKMEAVQTMLPYKLTDDQQRVLNSMLEDAKANRRINALLQGDVGCGKTIVAILLMTAMAENGYQSVLMAPTQVLARQHYESLQEIVGPMGFTTVYLGSELKKKDKEAALAAISNGTADFIVGTHSVIAENVQYNKLALTITDEEHKFGVAQRTALINKAAEGVHTITMSATPIPRTLAQVIYGNTLQLYTIRTMPQGRKPVITGLATTKRKLYAFILREAKAGHQTYVVCPLIDPSDKIEGVLSVEQVAEEYGTVLGPYGVEVATLTGRNSKADTEKTIEAFRNGKINVLVATSVVEVGVNVPTASLIVVSNAERFGLASLHQLRGRVGRSDIQSFCVLDCSRAADGGKAEKRLTTMCNTNDGFEIAKSDLAIRGAGDFLGTRQSGENKYMTLILACPDEYKTVQTIAADILAKNKKCKMVQQVQEERRAMETGP